MDQVLRELEVRKAPLPALLRSDGQLCSFSLGKAEAVAKGEAS